MTTANADVNVECTLFWEDKKALHDHLSHASSAAVLEIKTGSGHEIVIEITPGSDACFYGNDVLRGKRKRHHGCLVHATVDQGPCRQAYAAYDCALSKLIIKIIDDDEGRREVMEFNDLKTVHER